MGSSGGFFPKNLLTVQQRIEATRLAEQKQLEGEVNHYLQDLLVKYNQRNPKRIQEYLGKIEKVLKQEQPFQNFLFGGSVARHTYVDGLSDIDALVVLNPKELEAKTPTGLLRLFSRLLEDKLAPSKVVSIEKGRLAVTIKYKDQTEIQLLPALKRGDSVLIPSSSGKRWNETNPKLFQKAVAKANERLNGNLVPVMKLFKSINANLPNQKQLSGYHIEALCLDAVKGYKGAMTTKSILSHVLERSQSRVNSPIVDVTKQSRVVDEDLGAVGSIDRRIRADALASVYRRLNAATTLNQWKAILDQ